MTSIRKVAYQGCRGYRVRGAVREQIGVNARAIDMKAFDGRTMMRSDKRVIPGWFDAKASEQTAVLNCAIDPGKLPDEPVMFMSKYGTDDICSLMGSFCGSRDQKIFHLVSPRAYFYALKSGSFDGSLFVEFCQKMTELSEAIQRAKDRVRYYRMEKNIGLAVLDNMRAEGRSVFQLKMAQRLLNVPEAHPLCLFASFGIKYFVLGKEIDLQYGIARTRPIAALMKNTADQLLEGLLRNLRDITCAENIWRTACLEDFDE